MLKPSKNQSNLHRNQTEKLIPNQNQQRVEDVEEDGTATDEPRACPPARTCEEIVTHSLRLRQSMKKTPVRKNFRQICRNFIK